MDDFEETDSAIVKNVKSVELDAHCTEPAVVVKYELEPTTSDAEHLRSRFHSRRGQKIVRLKELNEDVEVSALAKYVIKCCPFISDRRIPELEQILYYLQKRQKSTSLDATFEPGASIDVPVSLSANLSNVEEYIEMLYEEIGVKVSGTSRIFQLSKDVMNVKSLVENETLVGALTRVLREDWKKSYDLATNIVSIFFNFSAYSDFHSVLAEYKIGTLCMQLVDFELKRWGVWKDEARASSDRNSSKKALIQRKQQTLVAVCINLLLNLAEDIKVELKMVNRNLVAMLAKCVAEKETSLNLLMAATNFLLKLSLFVENRQSLIDGRVVESISNLFPIINETLRNVATRLLFNMSFDPSACNQMVAAGLVSHVAQHIDKDERSLNLLYQLSMNDDAKAMIAYTDTIQILMRQLVSGNASEVSKALLLNIALEKRNAQLICGSDGSGLDLIATAALENLEHILIKVMRNIALHSGPSQVFFTKWVSRLMQMALKESEQSDSNLGFALDCLGAVNVLSCVQWSAVADELSLIPWIESILTHKKESHFPPDFLLQIVILCSTMARQLSAARSLLPLVDQFVELLSAQQEDDEMVIQIVYFFYVLITHEELSESLMGGSAQIGAYLLDLMHDRNLPIRSICDAALTIIADRSEEWARRMDVERFRWHNAQWLEMVADGNGVVSRDSTMSDSPDPFNVFGAEDLLDESEPTSSNDRFGDNY